MRVSLIVTLLGLLPLACQRASEVGGGDGPGRAQGTPEATQGSGVDTPPGAAASADTAGRSAAGPTDTDKAGGPEAAAPGEGAGDDAAPVAATQDTGQAAAGEERAGGPAAGRVMNGWKQYEANCSRCHGQDALGSAIAPDLRQSVKGAADRETFVQVVNDGRAEKGMPPFVELLDVQQIDDIHAYIVARSTGTLGPGRPGG